MAIPLYTTGSLSPTFVPVPPVGVTVKLPSAFALFEWFPTILREPLSASDTLSEATAPVKLPAWHCPTAGSRRLVRNPILQGWYPNSDSHKTGVLCSTSPTYPVHTVSNPSIKLAAESAQKAGGLTEEYRSIAALHHAEFLSAREVLGAECIGCDGIHFTEAGHQKLAEAVAFIIRTNEES